MGEAKVSPKLNPRAIFTWSRRLHASGQIKAVVLYSLKQCFGSPDEARRPCPLRRRPEARPLLSGWRLFGAAKAVSRFLAVKFVRKPKSKQLNCQSDISLGQQRTLISRISGVAFFAPQGAFLPRREKTSSFSGPEGPESGCRRDDFHRGRRGMGGPGGGGAPPGKRDAEQRPLAYRCRLRRGVIFGPQGIRERSDRVFICPVGALASEASGFVFFAFRCVATCLMVYMLYYRVFLSIFHI